jgi:DNA replication and repair protein RecF
MHINNIILNNFRNFELINILTKKNNIIYGKNASGKTNLLEGIYTILNGHSFLNKNKPLQLNISKKTTLSAKINNSNIYIDIYKGQKNIKKNTQKITSIYLKKNFPSILFSINSFISFSNKKYLFSLLDRNSFIENRGIVDTILEYNKLLKIKKQLIVNENKNLDMIYIVNDKIIKLIDIIAQERIKSVNFINANIKEVLKNFTDKKIDITYTQYRYDKNIIDLELEKKRIFTSLNKDRIDIIFEGNNIFTHSSMGEKKIVLLSLILTITKHYNNYIKPILLIDDLEGDLDKDFRDSAFFILKNLPNQLFLTTLGEYLYNDTNIIRL